MSATTHTPRLKKAITLPASKQISRGGGNDLVMVKRKSIATFKEMLLPELYLSALEKQMTQNDET